MKIYQVHRHNKFRCPRQPVINSSHRKVNLLGKQFENIIDGYLALCELAYLGSFVATNCRVVFCSMLTERSFRLRKS